MYITGAPNLFMSSFNEHIGGRQKSVFSSNVAYNMGLPNDPQKGNVWVSKILKIYKCRMILTLDIIVTL